MKITLKILYSILFLLAAFWLVAGFYMFFKEVKTELFWSAHVIGVLTVGNAFVFLLLAWGVWKRVSWVYYPGLVYLAVNVVLSLTDEIGIYDLISLVVSLVAFIFFYKIKAVILTDKKTIK